MKAVWFKHSMKILHLLILTLSISVITSTNLNSQTVSRSYLSGIWKNKGVLINKENVSFASADTLCKKLVAQRKAEKPDEELPKGDSMAIAMGADILCGLLHNMIIEINGDKMTFRFRVKKGESIQDQMQTLIFQFKDDTTLITTDERGNKAELKIIKLTNKEFIFSGISSARNMKLYMVR